MVPQHAYAARPHETIAAAIQAASAVGAAIAGPLGGPAVELVSAALTGAVAAHAVGDPKLVRRGAHRMTRRADAPLAAHAIQLADRARRADPRALRSAAMIVGRCASAHGGAILAHVALGWSAPLQALRAASAMIAGARAGAEVVRDLRRAATERDPIALEARLETSELAANDSTREVAA